MILASPPKLPATPCTAPWRTVPARFDRMDINEGHIRPLPSANNVIAAPMKSILSEGRDCKRLKRYIEKVKTIQNEQIYIISIYD
jgi:hypothetical protein